MSIIQWENYNHKILLPILRSNDTEPHTKKVIVLIRLPGGPQLGLPGIAPEDEVRS